jgi:hypothetical protein
MVNLAHIPRMSKKAHLGLKNCTDTLVCNLRFRADLTNIGRLSSVIIPESCSDSGTFVPDGARFI